MPEHRSYDLLQAEARIDALRAALRQIANAESGMWGRIAHEALRNDERLYPIGDPKAQR
jgi:hypothetical protein